MCQAELEGIDNIQIFHPVDADQMLAPFCPEDNEATQYEGGRHRYRVEQVGLDGLAKKQAQHGKRHERDSNVEGKALRGTVAAEARDDAHDSLAVFPAEGEDCARLDHDFEQLPLLVIEVQKIASQDKMPGRRDGKEFGKSFDNAEYQRLKQRVEIHGRRIKGRLKNGRRV